MADEITLSIYRSGTHMGDELFDRPIINVGKLSTSNLRLEDINVSRKHAVIERREGGQWRVTDLGSTNGTFVNGKRVVQSAIRNGDKLGFGETTVLIKLAAVAAAPGKKPDAKPGAPPPPSRRGKRRGRGAAAGAAAIRGLGEESFYDKKDVRVGTQQTVLEVALLWGETVLSIDHWVEPTVISIGEAQGCRFSVPAHVLGSPTFNLVEPRSGNFALNLGNPSISGDLLSGGKVTPLDELRAKGGDNYFIITKQTRARLKVGDFTLLISYGPAPARAHGSVLRDVDLTPIIFVVLSLILHSSFLIIIQMMPEESLRSSMDPAARRRKMVKMLRVQKKKEEKKEEKKKEEKKTEKKEKDISKELEIQDKIIEPRKQKVKEDNLLDKLTKRRTKDMGNPDIAPDAKDKKRAKSVAMTAGAAKVLTQTDKLDRLLEADTKPMPFKAVLGSTDASAAAFTTASIDPFGGGASVGTPGGFIGSSSVGGYHGDAGGGGRDGLVGGLGPGGDRARRISMDDRPIKPVAIASTASVSGRLDRATVQRIIRRYMSGIRWCYQDALQRNAKLAGKVTLSLTILGNGRVSNPSARNSSIRDNTLLNCITNKMKRWKFPSPKGGGVVKVTYPLILKTRR